MSRVRTQLPAFTLIEVLLATAVLAILMGAMGSLFVLAGNTVASRAGPMNQPALAADGLQDFTSDLNFAQAVSARERTRIVLTTQDRGGGGEVVTYSWSGTPGDPLVRTNAAGDSRIIIASVQSLSFTYDLRTETQAAASALVQGPEQSVFAYDAGTGLGASTGIAATSGFQMAFKPTLPSGTVSWNITRVALRIATGLLADGRSTVSLGKASSTGRRSRTDWWARANESSMDLLLDWRSFSVGMSTTYAPDDRVSLGIICNSGLDGIAVSTGNAVQPNTAMFKTSDEGESWSSVTGSLTMQVWGRPWVITNTTVTRKFLDRVNATIVAGSAGSPSYRFSAALPNRPEVP